MLTIGITGSSGSGKGYVCELFTDAGYPCLDTDKVCHDVYKKGHKCYDDILEVFGNVILSDDGEIDRKKLFETAFPDKEKYQRLNAIAFYHIMKETKKWIEEKREEGTLLAVIDAPMLYESGFDSLCDKVICVISERQTQIRRIMHRDGISEEAATLRLGKQQQNIYYTSRADYVLDNTISNENYLDSDAKRLISRLRRLAAEKA